MKKIILIVAGFLLISSAAYATNINTNQDHGKEDHDKVLVCVKSEEGFSVQSTFKVGKGQFEYKGTVDKKNKPTDINWCNDHQPNDVCPNIAGLQTKVPDGDILNADKLCVVPVIVPPTPAPTPTPVVTTIPKTTVLPATGASGRR